MGNLPSYLWLGFFAAAFLVHRTKRANAALSLGLIGMGLPSLLMVLYRMEVLPSDVFRGLREILPVISVASVGLLLFGVVRLVTNRGSATGNHRMLDADGTNLSTLFIPRNTTNTYSRAETLRDAACQHMAALARSQGIEVIEQKSNAHSPTVWFRLDYLLPQPRPDLSLRAHVHVSIERFDYHRFEHLYTVTAQVGTESKTITGIIDLDSEVTQGILRFIVQPGHRLRVPGRVREFPWQLWRPANKVDRLRPDWIGIGGVVLGSLLFALPVFGWVLSVAVFIGLYIRRSRRRTYVLTTGKPPSDPRSLRWMDSWQATVGGLGPAAVQVSDGIMSRIAGSAPPELSISVEHIGYWSVDSRVARDQVAVRYRRAIGFIQVIPHGPNLYVSWECHLNVAAWAEQVLSRGVERDTGLEVQANRVVSGIQPLNEYDVADANFLAEWIHESVKQVMKLKMAEHQIDQEIDFTIQRESRKEILSGGDGRQPAQQKTGLGQFKRVA
jgi:hypothetical protein